ncbi:sigma 54-interacting transcriptional regulator, partial [Syntrophomonas wolfei]
AIIVCNNGTVVFINKTYLDVLGKKKEEVVGKNVGDITPESRTLTVLRTGKAIVGYNWSVNGYNMIACALPIIKDGKVVACFAYSLFMDIWDAKDLVNNLMSELNMYRDEVRNLYSARHGFSEIIGQARNIQDMKFMAQKAALHPSITVLVTGESGTGKELFAHAIH